MAGFGWLRGAWQNVQDGLGEVTAVVTLKSCNALSHEDEEQKAVGQTGLAGVGIVFKLDMTHPDGALRVSALEPGAENTGVRRLYQCLPSTPVLTTPHSMIFSCYNKNDAP